ncbi:MAG: penicillin-binding transpeptidase domain-containing protein, partial [Chlamydiales bacterium]
LRKKRDHYMSSLLSKLAFCFLFIIPCLFGFSAEETFFLIDGVTNEKVFAFGPKLHERKSPCSTFKIILSLIGYDAKILNDIDNPVWDYQEGYDNFLESWKNPQTPQSWMQCSCVWFSKMLALQLGLEKLKNYLALLEYGNEDLSGGLTKPGSANTPAWIHSSLKISPYEQVLFLQKMILGKLPISADAVALTKRILFKEELAEGWQLFGKTGWCGSIGNENDGTLEYSWFVGWIEKKNLFFPFAYLICDKKIDLAQRIPRVKQLLAESNLIDLLRN